MKKAQPPSRRIAHEHDPERPSPLPFRGMSFQALLPWQFTVQTVPERLRNLKHIPWEGFLRSGKLLLSTCRHRSISGDGQADSLPRSSKLTLKPKRHLARR